MREEIVRAARARVGIPFQHMGRSLAGLDCDGVLISVARELGLVAKDFDVPPYTKVPDGKTFLEWCDRYMTRITQSEMQIGDAVVVIVDKHPAHIGILGDYVHGGFSIIHASNARSTVPARVIETRLMFSRGMKFVAAYRLPGYG